MTLRLAIPLAMLWAQCHALATELSDVPRLPDPAIGGNASSSERAESLLSALPAASTYLVVSNRIGGKGQLLGSTRGVAFSFQRDGSECTLITALHVVQGATEINVYRLNEDLSAGSGYEARVRWKSETKDVAGLTIRSTTDCTPILRAVDPPQLGQRTFAVLNAPTLRGMLTGGILGALWSTELGLTLVCDMRVYPGQSGSPLFDASGKLIGVVVSRSLSSDMSVAFALPVSAIQAELEASQ